MLSLLIALLAAGPAAAQVTAPDIMASLRGEGGQPLARLIVGLDRHLSGTTCTGGRYGEGSIFRLIPAAAPADRIFTLHSFTGLDGACPMAELLETSSGLLYGTTVRRISDIMPVLPSDTAERTGAAESGRAGTDWAKLIVAEGPAAADERQALVRALRLLPALPACVAVLDAERARPDVKPTLLRLDTFVVRGRPEVYVVRQSGLLQCAIRREALCTHALAAAIWHEMAHVEGADEHEARRREEAQWRAFIRDQQVDPIAALRYLRALVTRPDDHLLTSR